MDSLRSIMRYLEAGWGYASRCAQAPLSTPACDAFWIWVGVALALVVLLVVRKAVRHMLAVLAARRRQAELARVADQETMAQYKVDLDKLHAGSQDEDVERQIRRALDERKLKEQWQRPGATGKKEGG